MFNLRKIILIYCIVFAVTGCSGYPDYKNSQGNINWLPDKDADKILYARCLADDDIPSLIRFKNVETLDFAAGWAVMDAKITNRGLQYLAEPSLLPALTWLDLGDCYNITDEGLLHIAKMNKLKGLLLFGCTKITDKGLLYLAKMKSLETLDLRGCSKITDEGIMVLSEMNNLKYLRLGGCKKITVEGVQKIQALMPNCKVNKDDIEWNSHYKTE